MTLREAIAAATLQLADTPTLADTASRDAELLLLHQLHIDKAQRFADPDRTLTDEESSEYWRKVARRRAGEPIQYITGEQEFYGRSFHVTPAVLIPRPETEHLVEAVLERLPDRLPHDKPLRILDIGTGSGILAITLALHLPRAELTAVDTSPEALDVARRNAEVHAVADRIRFLESDLLSTLVGERFGVIVSNPPYIPIADRASLHPQVRDHEPSQALFAGEHGLDIYTRLIPQAHAALQPGGLLALEIGYGQREALRQLLRGWTNISFVPDLQGIPRVALATRST